MIILDTEEFWEVMCDPSFRRLTLNVGKIGNTMFCVDIPPEKVEGFIEDKAMEALDCLGYKARGG